MANNKNEGRLLVLDVKTASILSFDTEGKHMKTVLGKDVGAPDGIVVDAAKRHIYWTNMGEYREGQHFPRKDGTIERIDFDGSNRITIIPKGATCTPKQMQIDFLNGFIYWSDREGMRVMRAKLDGSDITTLIQAGEGDDDQKDETKHCVGIAIDPGNAYIYWSQKGPPNAGKGRIFRAGLDLAPGIDPANRKDVMLVWDNLPEPIDLEIDYENGYLYWTDRGDNPGGNSLNRAAIFAKDPGEVEVLCSGLKEAIGLALDQKNDIVYFTDLTGHIYSSTLDGSNFRNLYSDDKMLTGIAYLPGGL